MQAQGTPRVIDGIAASINIGRRSIMTIIVGRWCRRFEMGYAVLQELSGDTRHAGLFEKAAPGRGGLRNDQQACDRCAEERDVLPARRTPSDAGIRAGTCDRG